MKRTRLDRQQDFLMGLLRPFVHLWMALDVKRKVTTDGRVDFKRKEPYIMLANHTFMFDVIHVPLPFKHVPFIVANNTLFKKKSTKFLVSQVAHVISKSKGESDSMTVRALIGAVKKGYPILIFPEGDTTFFGETNALEPSTMKLIKKLELDVVTCHVKGGYLSKPRWATAKRKNRRVEFHYQITLSKNEVATLSVEAIAQKVKEALYFNAYLDQRQQMIKRPAKAPAEGLSDVLYVCPSCQSLHTLESKGNKIWCEACHAEGTIDDYGFIHGFAFDNLYDWNEYQRTFDSKLKEVVLTTSGELFTINSDTLGLDPLGKVDVVYRDHALTFSKGFEKIMAIQKIENPVVTFRRELTFSYEETQYLIKVDRRVMGLLRTLRDKY